MKTVLSVIAMVVLAPLVVSTTLVCGWPENWGGAISPSTIIIMSFFALFTVPVWPTYIPAVIIVPWIMQKISRYTLFRNMPVALLLLLSLLLGALGGMFVMFPLIRTALQDGPDIALQWKISSACSGAVTFSVICCIHRFFDSSHKCALAGNGSC